MLLMASRRDIFDVKVFKRALIACLLLLLSSSSLVRAQQSQTLSLDGTWQFALAKDEAAADALDGFYRAGYKPTVFQPSPVPSNWALQGFEEPHYKPFKGDASQGFYLHHFTVPAGYAGKRLLLHFGGVWSSAEVWFNGKPLGRHDSGFTSFAYDVTSFVKTDGDNLLAVRVRQVQHDYLLDTNDDWSLGGIYRDVTLEAMPHDRWLDRVDTVTTFDSQFRDADLDVKIMVGDQHKRLAGGNIPGGPGEPYDLFVTLKDQTGREVQNQQITIPAHYGTDRQTLLRLHVLRPLQWTAETPNLYTVDVALMENGVATHERTRTIGFRQISTAGGVFRINGQAVKLRGVDRHDEYPDVGRATTPQNWLQDLTLMKAANINFVRSSHYPPNEGFLDLCDKMGMYVEDEVPMGFGGDHANDPSYASGVMLRSYETVERDLNHPSIIMWSIGNEDPLTSLHVASARTVKALDPTRPTLMPWRTEQWMPDEFDILAPHYLTAQQVDEIAAHSTRPVLMTEYTHAFGKDGFGGLEERWNALTKHPTGTGGAIWMWADQGIEVTKREPDGKLKRSLLVVDDGFDGIVGPYREPQRDYWETKAVYAQVYPTIDRLLFIPGQAAVRIPIQNDFDFTDLNVVKMTWAVMEDAKQLGTGSTTIDDPSHSVGWLEIPLSSIQQVRPGATYYVRISFQHADGSEITARSVELVPPAQLQPLVPPQKIAIQQTDKLNIVVGNSSFTFDPKSGLLVEAAWKSGTVLTNMRPTIWRPLTATESSSARREANLQQLPDLANFACGASDWKVDQQLDRVVIHATTLCNINKKNHLTAVYEYTIDNAGRLTVHYSYAPNVEVRWIPQAGVSLDLSSSTKNLSWLGLGPYDTYPNENAAGVLGVWSGALGSEAVEGNKTTRWIEVNDESSTVHIQNPGYMRIDAKHANELQLLSVVVGRDSKGRRPEDPDQQLNVLPNRPFVGELTVELNQ